MGKYAVVMKNMVTNIVLWDGLSEWSPEDGKAYEVNDDVDIGWVYDGVAFTPPIIENDDN